MLFVLNNSSLFLLDISYECIKIILYNDLLPSSLCPICSYIFNMCLYICGYAYHANIMWWERTNALS